MPTKSGFRSSEFWLSVFFVIVGPSGVFIMAKDALSGYPMLSAILGWLAASGFVILSYIRSRTEVKIGQSKPNDSD